MAATDARVKFLRGLQANLPDAKTDGNIYIATDERAMYIDYNNGSTTERIRIGDFREYNNWAAIQAIDTANLSTTALYYARAENILCRYTGLTGASAWVQINPQNTDASKIFKSIATVVTASSNKATITTNFYDLRPGSGTNGTLAFSPAFAIESLNSTALTVTKNAGSQTVSLRVRDVTNTVTPVIASYSENSVTGGTVTIRNIYSGTDSAGTAVNSTTDNSFNIVGANGTTVSVVSGAIQVNTNYRVGGAVDNTNKYLKIGLLSTETANNGTITVGSELQVRYQFVVGDNRNNNSTTTIGTGANDVTYTYSTANSARTATVTANLPVYTIAQIDELIATKFQSANAMTYKGTVPTTGSGVSLQYVLPSGDTNNNSGVSIGDVYYVNCPAGDTVTIKAGSSGTDVITTSARQGDLLIASAAAGKTENSAGYLAPADIVWTLIPSGDDAINSYKLATAISGGGTSNQFTYLYLDANGSGMTIGDKAIGVGTGLEIDSSITTISGGTNNGKSVVYIKHTPYNTASVTSANSGNKVVSNTSSTASRNQTFSAITGLTIENGHVTGTTTETFQVAIDDGISAIQLAQSLSNNVLTLTPGYKPGWGGSTWTNGAAMSLTSSSLTITKPTSAASYSVDLMWESFDPTT